jgi:hypothetical protein
VWGAMWESAVCEGNACVQRVLCVCGHWSDVAQTQSHSVASEETVPRTRVDSTVHPSPR